MSRDKKSVASTLQFDTVELRRSMRTELERRRLSPAPGDYSYNRDNNDAPFYGVIGAVNLHAELGFDFGGPAERRAWIDRINSFQTADGSFDCVSGPEHAAAMAIIALNLLGGQPARPVRHLAPLRATELDAWLNRMNWTDSTHKEFWGAVSPILASGFGDAEWVTILCRNVGNRISPEQPLQTWCRAGESKSKRVISCIYHVLSAFDAAFLPYPHPHLIWDRLAALDYERTRNDHIRTCCTDFDYAWVLYRLCHQLPGRFAEFHERCNAVLDRMITEWREDREGMLKATTHELYCQCIGWAVYQNILPERFSGPALMDTLNAPWLYRLPGPEFVAAIDAIEDDK